MVFNKLGNFLKSLSEPVEISEPAFPIAAEIERAFVKANALWNEQQDGEAAIDVMLEVCKLYEECPYSFKYKNSDGFVERIHLELLCYMGDICVSLDLLPQGAKYYRRYAETVLQDREFYSSIISHGSGGMWSPDRFLQLARLCDEGNERVKMMVGTPTIFERGGKYSTSHRNFNKGAYTRI